jgi:hypothetical protein
MEAPMKKLAVAVLAAAAIGYAGPANTQAVYSGTDSGTDPGLAVFPSNAPNPIYTLPPNVSPPQPQAQVPNFGSGAYDANTTTYARRCSQAPIRPDVRASGNRYCY